MGNSEGSAVGQSVGKANFDDIYTAPDPREYFRVLVGLDYIIPDLAKGIFRSLINQVKRSDGNDPLVIDVGSSYGINSAVIDYPLDIQRLARRYMQPDIYTLPPREMRRLDKSYFASWPKVGNARFVGVDTSEPAISYARSVGLMDGGVTTNLEESDPTPQEAALLADADLMITTGCVGYVTAKTFRRILACRSPGQPLVVASFVLRMYSYGEFADELARHGLVTERLDGVTFVQRRFHSNSEFDSTLSRLESMGVDPAGKEADGLFHAELFVSRTPEAVDEIPLGDLISVTSGENQTRGRRFKLVQDNRTEFVH
jgi:hypothetical protein